MIARVSQARAKRPRHSLRQTDKSPSKHGKVWRLQGGSVRKPRVLPILPTALVRHAEVDAPISHKQQLPPKIARSQYVRIRTWARYGMTTHQVAELYGVAVGEIERILRMT